METTKEKYDVFTAVFNCHVNDAHTKAMEELREMNPDGAASIEKLIEDEGGIMAIFRHEPSFAEIQYATLVTHYVNYGGEEE